MSVTTSPRIVARFETDASGRPTFKEVNGVRHYKVVFEVENPPEDTYAASFQLDPDTYYDSYRTLTPDRDGRISSPTFPRVSKIQW